MIIVWWNILHLLFSSSFTYVMKNPVQLLAQLCVDDDDKYLSHPNLGE